MRLVIILTYRPCLVILDLMLLKLSEEEFCKWIKERAGNEV